MKNRYLILILAIVGLSPGIPSEARIGGIGFFRAPSSPRLAFTTAAQSLNSANCSGVTTIETRDAAGTPANVGSNLTVNLTTPDSITFYSDSYCTSTTTSITVLSGASTASFYFIASAAGTPSYTAAATGYSSAAQSATIAASPFIWTGAGADANWSTALNWSGGAAPSTTSHVAIFDGTCSANCSPNITSTITNLSGIRMNSGYSGTITQNAGVNITFSGTGLVVNAGTFQASTAADQINFSGGPFRLASGTFNAGATTINVDRTWNVSGGTFTPATSTIIFSVGSWATRYIYVASETYNKVTFRVAGYAGAFSLTGTMNVSGLLDGSSPNGGGGINGGTVAASANVTASSYGFGMGSGKIKLVGSTSQSIAATGVNCEFPAIEIASTGGTVSLSGLLGIGGNYTVTSGTISATGSTLSFGAPSWATRTVTLGAETYDGFTMSNLSSSTFSIVGTLRVAGTLTGSASGGSTISGGDIYASGPVTLTGYGLGSSSSTTLYISGTGSQAISATGSDAILPKTEIVSTGGTVSLSGIFNLGGNYKFTSGVFNPGTSTIIVNVGDWGSRTINVGTENYYNFYIAHTGSNNTLTISGNINVLGIFVASAVGSTTTNGGKIIAKASVLISQNGFGSSGGTTVLQMAGSSGQTINASSTNRIPNLELNTPSVVTILGGTQVMSATTVTSGTMNLFNSASYFTTGTLALGGSTLTKNGGTLTVGGVPAGTGALYGGTVAP